MKVYRTIGAICLILVSLAACGRGLGPSSAGGSGDENPAPGTIVGEVTLIPSSAARGAEITITGVGVIEGTTVTLGGSPCTPVSITGAASLTCQAGAHFVGAVDAVITIPGVTEAIRFPNAFAYKSFLFLGDISGNLKSYALEANGTPTFLATYSAGGAVERLTLDPRGRFLVVDIDSEYKIFLIDPLNANLTPADSIMQFEVGVPIAIAPNGKTIYVLNVNINETTIKPHSIDPVSGVITPGIPIVLNQEGNALAISSSGTSLYLGILDGTHAVLGMTVSPDGLAAHALPYGGTPNSARVLVSPSDEFVFVANSNSGLYAFVRNPDSGALNGISSPLTFAFDGAFELVVHPTLRRIYIVYQNHGILESFVWDSDGAVANTPTDYIVGTGPRDIALDPSGSYLYVPNQISDSMSILRIDPASGELNLLDDISVPDPTSVVVD